MEELRVRDAAGAYRVIYTARLADAVYVLHASQKKTRRTAPAELELARQRFKQVMRVSNPMTAKTYTSVFDAIANTPQEAVNLRLRAEVMQRIAQRIERKGWTQAEAAKQGGITQPRINDLVRGRLSRFSLDALVNIAAAMGLRMELKAA